MKKNYFFGKAIAAMAILFGVSMGLVSCGNADDPIEEIVTPETPVTFTVTKTSGTTATTVILTPGNITDALKEVLADIVDAADAGETYTLTIDCSNLTINDTEITIPKVDGANLVLKFENVPSSDNPLQFEPKSLDGDGTPSAIPLSELTIIMPDAASLDLNINLPETHVNLEGGYGTVAAVTSLGTLEVKDGAVVNFLNWLGGSVIVDEGGEIKGFVFSTDQLLTDSGIEPIFEDPENSEGFIGWANRASEWDGEQNVYFVRNADDSPYIVNRIKVIKGEVSDIFQINGHYGHAWGGNTPVEELIIGEGVKVVMTENPQINKLTFDDSNSTHEILYTGDINVNSTMEEGVLVDIDIEYYNNPEVDLKGIKGLNGITFKPIYGERRGRWNWHMVGTSAESGEWVMEFEDEGELDANPVIQNIPYDTENCKFIANKIEWLYDGEGNVKTFDFSDGVSIKNCTFKHSDNDYEGEEPTNEIVINYPPFSADFKSMPIKFDGCTFDSTLKFVLDHFGGEYPEGSAINYIFTDCTYGSEAFAKTGFFKEFGGTPENLTLKVTIDATDYSFAYQGGTWKLFSE